MGVDHNNEGSKSGATVTPIRPEIQLRDTTPFGITPPGPTPPSADDEDTWGSSPRRRMQASEPVDHPVGLTANDRNREDDAAAGAGPIGPSVDATHADDELDSNRRLVRQLRSHAPGSWRAAAALALIALLGAAVALMNAGAPVASPRAATSNISATGYQPSAALPSLLNQFPPGLRSDVITAPKRTTGPKRTAPAASTVGSSPATAPHALDARAS